MSKQKNRVPIVTVLGHVDHGKTTLLDTIRKANVAASESGGITQHVGAYQVQVNPKKPEKLITFIDTPGHEAFSKMRSRGAKVADIAILIVAANDGVKPQTIEAIKHIKQAKIPFIVAINKIDIDGVILDNVKGQLVENEVFVEGYGGDIVAIPISAKKNKGIDQLLEMIDLMFELEQENQEISQELEAVVLESYIDPHKGVIANIVLRSGSFKIGDQVWCENKMGKVKIIISSNGKHLNMATAGQPVQLLGFKNVLPVGSIISKNQIEKKDKEEKEEKANLVKNDEANADDGEEQKRINIILKTDVAGTLEAIKANLTEEINLIDAGVGELSESDVLLARSTNARLIGFHINIPSSVKKLAEMEEVKIETFDVIYHLLEDLQKRVLKLLEPTINEEVLGKAEVIAEFSIHKTHIAGCKVTEGVISRPLPARVMRGDRVIAEVKFKAMQVERKDVTDAKKKQEVALVFRPDVKFKLGDQVISYKVIED